MNTILKITIPIPIVSALIWLYKNYIGVFNNYRSRPKLNLEIKKDIINFITTHKTKMGFWYTSLFITNATDKALSINLREVKINNESYAWADPKISWLMHPTLPERAKQDFIDCDNDVLRTCSIKWPELHKYKIVISPYDKKSFPLPIVRGSAYKFLIPKRGARVLLPKHKIVFTININGRDYDYAIPIVAACKHFIAETAPEEPGQKV